MEENTSKQIVPATILVVCLIVILISIFGSQRQKKEEILKAKMAQRDAEERLYLMGKFDPAAREDFALVPRESAAAGTKQMYLRKETLDAFLKMQAAAKADGVEIKIASATRNFDYQKEFWDKEWSGEVLVNGKNLAETYPDGFSRYKKILEYVAVPGTSRHHWGTDVDLNGGNAVYFETQATGIKEYQWLVKNAGAFGFCQTYRSRELDKRTGYSEEKWHWSYLPLSRNFTAEYGRLIKNEDINGFLGDEYVIGQDMVHQYALNINPACL